MEFLSEAKALLERNRRRSGEAQYTVPSPLIYPYQWLWDSCFHAIALSKFDPDAAIAELRTLLSRQYPDGLVPHIIFWTPKITRPYNVGWKNNISKVTQPPMVAYALLEIYKKTGDATPIAELFPKAYAFYRYVIEQRDPHDHHLASIINPDESGEDNSPRFDGPMRLRPSVSFVGHMYARHKLSIAHRVCDFDAATCMTDRFWVKDVPFNAVLVRNLEALAELAAIVGDERAGEWARRHRALVADAMRAELLEDGVFWSASGPEHTKLKVHTWAHFAPLFAGLYTPEEARALVETHFHNETTFKSKFGIRTVSKREPSYRSNGFWRGPIWFAPHWFLYKGLTAYGFTEEAAWIRERSLDLVRRHGFREYFDPESGRAYGARGFTWGTLVLDMQD